jgi:hypothetical protein
MSPYFREQLGLEGQDRYVTIEGRRFRMNPEDVAAAVPGAILRLEPVDGESMLAIANRVIREHFSTLKALRDR